MALEFFWLLFFGGVFDDVFLLDGFALSLDLSRGSFLLLAGSFGSRSPSAAFSVASFLELFQAAAMMALRQNLVALFFRGGVKFLVINYNK